MQRARRNHEERSRWREQLGALVSVGISMLSGVARRLGSPALASVPVSAVILHRVDTVSIDQPLEDVAQLLVARGCSEVPIVDGTRPVGVVTRDDLAAGVQELGPHAPVAQLPRRAVLTVSPSDPVEEVLGRLRTEPDSVAVLVDHGAPVGVLTAEHLIEYLSAEPAGRRGGPA